MRKAAMTNEDQSLVKCRPPSGICFVRISANAAPSGRITTKASQNRIVLDVFGEK